MHLAAPDRRVRLLAAALVALLLVAGPALAQTEQDEHEGHDHGPPDSIEADNDPRVLAIADQLTCYCGCNTQSIADCTCGVAQKERRTILSQLDDGETAETILAGWVDRYGVRILMEPPREGFNLLGWFLPGALVLAAMLFLFLRILRWSGRPEAVTAPPEAPDAVDSAYREQIRRELERRQG